MASKTLIFVYGSLRRGQQHHGQIAEADFIGTRRTAAAYRIVRYVGGYPALTPSAECGQAIHGEVYLVDDRLLVRLDEFEECPTLYERLSIVLEDGTNAQAYLIDSELAKAFPPWQEDLSSGAP